VDPRLADTSVQQTPYLDDVPDGVRFEESLLYLSIKTYVSVDVIRALSRIYRLGEKSRVVDGHKLPGGGVRGHAPPEIFGNEYVLRCSRVHFETQF